MPDKEFKKLCDVFKDEDEEKILSMPYYDFLKTKYWETIRMYLLYLNDSACQLCGKSGNIAIHHLSYENHGREHEHLEDLLAVCKACHCEIHNKHKYFKRENGHLIRLNGHNINIIWNKFIAVHVDIRDKLRLIETKNDDYLKNTEFISYLMISGELLNGEDKV